MDVHLNAKIKETNYGTIIALSGQLTSTNCRKANFFFREVLTENVRRIALDLNDLEYLDSSGLRELSTFIKLLNEKSITLYAFGMNEDVYDILDMIQLEGEIKLCKENDFKISSDVA